MFQSYMSKLKNLFCMGNSTGSEMFDSKAADASLPASKAVICTALPLECKAVLEHLKQVREERHPQGSIYYVGTFESHDGMWDIGVVETGQGNSAASAETERALQYFQPDVAIFVGIAGGIKDVSLGDVVAATQVHDYESGREDGNTFGARPKPYSSSHALTQRALAEVTHPRWSSRIIGSPAKPRAFVGSIASGGKIVASTKAPTMKLIKSKYNDTLAVETEGCGFLEAVHKNQSVQGLVVRGISDLIDLKDRADASGSQPIAAKHASAFAFEILANFNATGEISNGIDEGQVANTILSLDGPQNTGAFENDSRIDDLLRNVGLGDWEAAREAAIKVLAMTEESGDNELFQALLEYQDCPDDDMKWSAILTIESFAELAPWLIDRSILIRMASSEDFSIRGSAASICMTLANIAPDQLPTDMLVKLAVPDEDYYVDIPATAALKILARNRPAILRIFFVRLTDPDTWVRRHAAEALEDISRVEPEILDVSELKEALARIKPLDDPSCEEYLSKAIRNVGKTPHESPYKYGF